jgi:glycogen(starch) synthase
MGVPAITSNLSGFGGYVHEAFPDHDEWGLQILNRRGERYHDVAADLTERVLAFCRLGRQGRIALRNQAVAHSQVFDWSTLADAYHRAHDRALASRFDSGGRDDGTGGS